MYKSVFTGTCEMLGICLGRVLMPSAWAAVILGCLRLDEWCSVLLPPWPWCCTWLCPWLWCWSEWRPPVLAMTGGGGRGCWGRFSLGSASDAADDVVRIDWARLTTPGLAGWCRISFNVFTASATLSDRSGMHTVSALLSGWSGIGGGGNGSEFSSSRKSGGGGSAARSISSGAGGAMRPLAGNSADGVTSAEQSSFK